MDPMSSPDLVVSILFVFAFFLAEQYLEIAENSHAKKSFHWPNAHTSNCVLE